MNIFNIFVLIVGCVSLKNVLTERQHVGVGEVEFHCGVDGQIIRIKSNTIKLRLPVNCQAMYSVNTERTTACTNQQSCILMTWKIIRQLEMFLNVHNKNTGTNGIVEFKNEMLLPDFNYLLHVILKNSEGQIIQEDFNITFAEDNKNESDKILGRLDLHIGTPIVYSSLPVIINANVTLCGNISYYFFRWSISMSKQKVIIPKKSSQLIITPEILKTHANQSLIIFCQVIHVKNDTTIVKGSIKINITDPPLSLENKIHVILPFKYTTVNRGAPISITPYIYSLLMPDEDYKIEWSCMFESSWLYGCQQQTNKEFYMDRGFDQHGNYSVTIRVTRGKLENSATCSIIVGLGVPSIELDIEHPIRPEKGIQVTAKIYELRTYCFVYWDSEEENYLDLNEIPGFHKITYNISSKDKTFLEEIEENGNITVTKQFKLIIPPPFRNWKGLNTSRYNMKIIVTCPPLTEINDMDIIEETPHNFVTISAQSEFYVYSMPEVKSFEVSSEENIALKSYYIYKVEKTDDINGLLIYKYGFVLENIDVIFYSGIEIFTAKTIMPYNGENGIDTFIEVCDYQNRCGKTFGPIIKTRKCYDLDKNSILKIFKQLLIEEDFYKAFSYAFLVLHSMNSLEQTKEYGNMFSSEICKKIKILINDDSENTRININDLVENIVVFVQYLVLSEEVMEQMLFLTREFSTNSISQYHSRTSRQVSKNLLSITEYNVTLEEIKNYLIASEYVIINSINNESRSNEKDHMLNLLDGWMVLACNLIFNGQRVTKLELRTMVFSIEKISKAILDRYITIPTSDNIRNKKAKLKINDMNGYSSNKLCLGKTMLKNFFNKNGLIFGANIYSADEHTTEISIAANIRVFLPIDTEMSRTMHLKCTVYKSGFIFPCSIVKQYTDFIDCLCPSFGYYFTEYSEILTHSSEDRHAVMSQNISYDNFNKTDNYKIKENNYGQKISYVVIVSSLMGFLILCYIIRKLSIMPPQNSTPDNILYGHVMHDELLE